jgi:signal transduction histidine kinase
VAPPFPPEALQVICNPLVQVAKSKSEPHERPSTSLGLGLYIAREIVLANGGSIEVSSTAETGTPSAFDCL